MLSTTTTHTTHPSFIMPFKLDPEVGARLAEIYADKEPPPPSAVGDYKARRDFIQAFFSTVLPPMPKDVSTKDYYATASDGHKILLRWYAKEGAPKGGPAVVYTHGGGYIGGSVPLYDSVVGKYVTNTGVPFLNVEYRLAPESQYPTNVSDAHAGLVWLHDHASELGVDPSRIAIMGDSGGGGLAAALAHWNKEKNGPSIAKQILIYPMLDDRNIQHDSHIGQFAVWSDVDNETGWGCLLGSKRGAPDVPPSAAPARMTDATGLPPAYIETGELDIFRNEDIEYAAKFGKAGISIELHVHPGVPHAFEGLAPDSKVAKRAFEDRYRAIQTIEPLDEPNAKL